ncbi:hypothetical protein HPB50_028513 [Hyalomma asiaticum]|nr:hypothetical protein HPB50_028513 [Hyalomma asiaticum]
MNDNSELVLEEVTTKTQQKTRIGQGACWNMPPDLSIVSGADAVTWSNLNVLCVTVGEDDSEEDVCLKARIVEWEQFWKNIE